MLIGDVGYRHVGDDALFGAALGRLRACWPAAEITAMSCYPDETAALFGIPAVALPCHDGGDEARALFGFQLALDVAAEGAAGAWLPEIDTLHAAVAAIRRADAVVVAGGGNIHAHWPHHVYGRAAALAIAQAQGIPTALSGQTIGPELSALQRRIIAEPLRRAAVIGVREEVSGGLLRELGVEAARISDQPDDALADAARAAPLGPPGTAGRVIVATLGHNTDVETPLDRQAGLLRQLVAFADREDLAIALCPHTEQDATRHEQLNEALGRPPRIRLLKLRGVAETRSTVARATMVVSTRYHPLVFALAGAVPAIALHHGAYSRAKALGIAQRSGIAGCDLDLGEAPERLDALLGRLLRERGALVDRLAAARAAAVASLDRHWERLCAAIAPAAATPPDIARRGALPMPRPAVAVPPLTAVIAPLRIEGDEAVASARLESEGQEPAEIFFRLPASAADPAVLGDTFLLSFLFPAMTRGRDLHIAGTVSPSLVESLDAYQATWRCWRADRYRRVAITADACAERPPAAARRSIFGFSSGLDSSYTAWKLSEDKRPAAGVTVHGYNIPLSDRAAGAALHRTAAATLAGRGIEPLAAATNWRETFPGISWDDAAGIMVAAALTLFSGRFSDGMISSTDDVRRFDMPKGSQPAIDALLGSARFPIRHFGHHTPRLAKLAAVAGWREAFDALHVCWLHGLATNCGRCVRCFNLAAACDTLGLPLPRSLPEGPYEMSAFKGSENNSGRTAFMEDTVRAAALVGSASPRIAASARALKDWRRRKKLRLAHERLNDRLIAKSNPGEDRWSALGTRLDRLLGSKRWRAPMRPLIRAIRRTTKR